MFGVDFKRNIRKYIYIFHGSVEARSGILVHTRHDDDGNGDGYENEILSMYKVTMGASLRNCPLTKILVVIRSFLHVM